MQTLEVSRGGPGGRQQQQHQQQQQQQPVESQCSNGDGQAPRCVAQVTWEVLLQAVLEDAALEETPQVMRWHRAETLQDQFCSDLFAPGTHAQGVRRPWTPTACGKLQLSLSCTLNKVHCNCT